MENDRFPNRRVDAMVGEQIIGPDVTNGPVQVSQVKNRRVSSLMNYASSMNPAAANRWTLSRPRELGPFYSPGPAASSRETVSSCDIICRTDLSTPTVAFDLCGHAERLRCGSLWQTKTLGINGAYVGLISDRVFQLSDIVLDSNDFPFSICLFPISHFPIFLFRFPLPICLFPPFPLPIFLYPRYLIFQFSFLHFPTSRCVLHNK